MAVRFWRFVVEFLTGSRGSLSRRFSGRSRAIPDRVLRWMHEVLASCLLCHVEVTRSDLWRGGFWCEDHANFHVSDSNFFSVVHMCSYNPMNEDFDVEFLPRLGRVQLRDDGSVFYPELEGTTIRVSESGVTAQLFPYWRSDRRSDMFKGTFRAMVDSCHVGVD